MPSTEDEALAKKKGKKKKTSKPRKKPLVEKQKEVKGEDGPPDKPGPKLDEPGFPDIPEPVKEKVKVKEKAPWKGIGLAVGVAIGINAAFLPVVFIPFIGVIVVLMLGPYTAAFVGGKRLRREKKGDWLSATFWVVIIWPSIIMFIVFYLLSTLGSFDLKIEMFGAMIIGMIYVFPLMFTLAGFYQGSVPPEERDEEDEMSGVEDIEKILGFDEKDQDQNQAEE